MYSEKNLRKRCLIAKLLLSDIVVAESDGSELFPEPQK